MNDSMQISEFQKLIDLGIAKSIDTDSGLTRKGLFVGKLHYAAPEQLEKAAEDLDGRADLHALGIVLYQVVKGDLVESVFADGELRTPRMLEVKAKIGGHDKIRSQAPVGEIL